MKIETYRIKTSSGFVKPWGDQLNFLTENEKNEFDLIGYAGCNVNGEHISRTDYLNSLNKGEFQVEQTKCDNGDFSEEFDIVRVI